MSLWDELKQLVDKHAPVIEDATAVAADVAEAVVPEAAPVIAEAEHVAEEGEAHLTAAADEAPAAEEAPAEPDPNRSV